MSRLRWMGKLDMYRKVPVDLMEGTKRGSYLSLFAVFAMLLLFLLETGEFFKKRLVADLALDTSKEKRVRVNFNITLMDLSCDYAVVDVVSVYGTQQNVTANVNKWGVDAAGVRQRFQGRNKEQRDIRLYDEDVTESLEELLEDGEAAVSLDEETFQFALNEKQFLFVDFYASWCSHCKALMPTWEVLGRVMEDAAEEAIGDHDYTDEEYEEAKNLELPVLIAKVDCVAHKTLCQKQMIRAYPTLRLFVDGTHFSDYKGHRSVTDFTHWLAKAESVYLQEVGKVDSQLHAIHEAALERMKRGASAAELEWADKLDHKKKDKHGNWIDEDHPGCQISGHLFVDRVPGNFHIQARSPHHDMDPHMANLSHEVHHLSMGEPIGVTFLNKGTLFAPDEVKKKISPMDGNVYVLRVLHESYHHYLKVITTSVKGLNPRTQSIKHYQILQSSNLASYRTDQVPEAKFILDLSPISVSYRSKSRHWYDYLTSLLAIVGGTFSIIGFLDVSLNSLVERKRKMRYGR